MPLFQIKPGSGVEVIRGQFIEDKYAEFINPTPETAQVATNIHNTQWPRLSRRAESGTAYANLRTRTPVNPVVIDKVLKNGVRAEIHRQDYRKITEIKQGDDETLTIRGELIDYSFTNDEDFLFYTKEGNVRGDERQELYCVNTRTGASIWKEGNVGDVIIAGEDCVYQLRTDETSMNRTVWRRGTRRNGREELVYRELIPTNSLSIEPTSDRRHVIISRSAWLDAEFLKVRLKMDGRVEKVCRGIRGVRVDTYGDLVIIQRGEALYLLDALRGDAIINEDPVLRERPGTQLMDWVCYKNSIIVAETNLGKLQLKIIQFSPARRRWRVQELGGNTLETLSHGDIYGGAEIETGVGVGAGGDEILIYVKGVLTPSMTLGVRVPEQGEFKGDEVRIVSMSVCNRFDRGAQETVKQEGTSDDGTKVPYVVFRNRGVVECKGAYLLVYGSYGSIGQFDDFSLDLISLMDAGVWVVIGMIRGGGEFGKKWHLAGAGLNKMNSVNDCKAVVEDLHNARGVPGIVVKGRSAGAYVAGRLLSLGVEIGGLRGVVIQVGFVDNLMSMLDQSAPLTLGELREFGNPLMRKADMAFLNENGVIPSLLKCDERCQGATARVGVYLEYGLNDTRVRYTEGLRLYLALKEKRIGRSVVGLFFPERGHLRGDQYDDAEALIDGVRVEWILRHLEIGGA